MLPWIFNFDLHFCCKKKERLIPSSCVSTMAMLGVQPVVFTAKNNREGMMDWSWSLKYDVVLNNIDH